MNGYRCIGAIALVAAAVPLLAMQTPVPPATQDDDNAQYIVVVGPSGEDYRLTADALRDAVKAYDRNRALFAPDARLLFAVAAASGSLDGLSLYLRSTKRLPDGHRRTISLPLDPQGRFALPGDLAIDGTWELRSNRRRGGIRIRPLVLSPATEIADRRFGDLRLQCRVALAFARISAPWRLLADAVNVCANRRVELYARSPQPLANATLRWDGKSLPLALRADSYRVPLSDRAVPDKARLALTYR